MTAAGTAPKASARGAVVRLLQAQPGFVTGFTKAKEQPLMSIERQQSKMAAVRVRAGFSTVIL